MLVYKAWRETRVRFLISVATLGNRAPLGRNAAKPGDVLEHLALLVGRLARLRNS